jgi:hypothetical protein
MVEHLKSNPKLGRSNPIDRAALRDKELLELAAKAHGDLRYVNDGETWRHVLPSGLPGAWWNPLEDDGDAMRLAVKLRIVVQHAPRYVVAIYGEKVACHVDGFYVSATRRAIVRAAAAIGKEQAP